MNGKWDARIRRAGELAQAHPFASEGLRFYQRLAQFQKFLYGSFETDCGQTTRSCAPGALRDEFDPFVLLPRFPSLLGLVEASAPAILAQSARALQNEGAKRWQAMLERFWWDGKESAEHAAGAETVISWIFLQPYAEYLADYTERSAPNGTPSTCPLCGGKPQVAAFRPEGDGAKRSLICALCSTEWDYRRLVCPSCGEEDVHKLAVYSAAEFKHVRVDACDSCRTYLKTVDLTKNGHAVPVVDELAMIPLDLWAAEHGYAKLQTNLLGI